MMKNIVVMGTCEAEVQGVLSLLEGEGISAVRAGGSPLGPDDLLIVASECQPIPITGLARLSKTAYGRRNRALSRMVFCHL